MMDPLNGGKVVVFDGVLYYQKSFPPLYNINVQGMRVSPPAIPKLPTFLPSLEWLIPKPKTNLLYDFINMACLVHQKHKAECEAFIVYYKDRNEHELFYPEQEVESASCLYNRNIIPEGSMFIGEMHSHHTMSTFFSSTDDKDDNETTDLFPKISMVFGKMNQFDMLDPTFKTNIKCRLSYQGTFSELFINDIFELNQVAIPDCIKKRSYASTYQPSYSYYGYKPKTMNHTLIKMRGSDLYNPEEYLGDDKTMKIDESDQDAIKRQYASFFGVTDEKELCDMTMSNLFDDGLGD